MLRSTPTHTHIHSRKHNHSRLLRAVKGRAQKKKKARGRWLTSRSKKEEGEEQAQNLMIEGGEAKKGASKLTRTRAHKRGPNASTQQVSDKRARPPKWGGKGGQRSKGFSHERRDDGVKGEVRAQTGKKRKQDDALPAQARGKCHSRRERGKGGLLEKQRGEHGPRRGGPREELREQQQRVRRCDVSRRKTPNSRTQEQLRVGIRPVEASQGRHKTDTCSRANTQENKKQKKNVRETFSVTESAGLWYGRVRQRDRQGDAAEPVARNRWRMCAPGEGGEGLG